MRFPMEALLDRIQYLNPVIRLPRRGQWIKGINLMPRSAENVDAEMLYFCTEQEHLPKAASAPCVLVSPRPDALPDNENCVILPYGTDITEVFNDCLRFLTHIHDWMQETELSISRNEGVQRILDLSEKILGNPIVIITPAFRTYAATYDLETTDRVFTEFCMLGYLTRETWFSLRDNDYYREEYYSGWSAGDFWRLERISWLSMIILLVFRLLSSVVCGWVYRDLLRSV